MHDMFADPETGGEKEPKAAGAAAEGENGVDSVFREEGGAFDDVLPGGFVASVQKHGVGHAACDASLCACETVLHALWQALDNPLRPDVDWHGGSPAFPCFREPALLFRNQAAVAGEEDFRNETPWAIGGDICPEFKIFANPEILPLAASRLGDGSAYERGSRADMVACRPCIIEVVQLDRLLGRRRIGQDRLLAVEGFVTLHDADGDCLRMAPQEFRRLVEEIRLPEIVAVQKGHEFACGCGQASVSGGGRAMVAVLFQNLHGGDGETCNDIERVVCRGVIDDDDFNVMAAVLRRDGTERPFDERRGIVGWDDVA